MNLFLSSVEKKIILVTIEHAVCAKKSEREWERQFMYGFLEGLFRQLRKIYETQNSIGFMPFYRRESILFVAFQKKS